MRATIVTLFFTLGTSQALAQTASDLSEVALYHRCYTRLTGAFPDYVSDIRLAELRSGSTNAIDLCMEVLDTAALQLQGARATMVQPNDALSRSVLRTFHTLHGSWFLNRTFPEFDDVVLAVESLYDASEPAGYLTRALFLPKTSVSSAWTENQHLRVSRDPEGTLHEIPPSAFSYSNAPLLQMGPVTGFEVTDALRRDFLFIDEEDPSVTGVEIGAHLGGGFMGSSPYLLINVSETLDFRANGGRKMPRKWAKAVLHDVLCRELPAVRPEDAIAYVDTTSQVPFRRQTNCTQCHATMDQMASTIRGFSYFQHAALADSERAVGGLFPAFDPVTMPAESGWPAVEDEAYASRPPNGRIYFRDYQGQLVDLPVQGPAQLGAALSQMDDPYICLARRYYRYFTGIEAYIGDPAGFPATPQSADAYHRNQVIILGQQLKSSGSLRQLIESILRSSDYRKPDFGASR